MDAMQAQAQIVHSLTDAIAASMVTWANQRRLKEEIKAAFPDIEVIRIDTVSEEGEKELSEGISI